MNDFRRRAIFWLALLVCLVPFVSPPLALAIGLLLALTVGHPYAKETGRLTKLLLQASVVGLGFGMNLQRVMEAGSRGFWFTVATIVGTLALGFAMGRLLRVPSRVSHLISSGTAICGGSAIAAVAPVVGANAREISVALGTVFVLNSVALFVFPWIGFRLGMSAEQFGVWSAIAIHDTSSVVGAAAKFSREALEIATTVKLARALWIVPLTIVSSLLFRGRSTRVSVPLFIVLFLLASVVRTYLPVGAPFFEWLVVLAKTGLKVTLFLIGVALSREALRAVGWRPLAQGVALWLAISGASLWAVLSFL